uniref:Retrovirus-related Pol polyprotein from transposon TNT 1-94 n=1 Tax=Tanacetum cinerariifolium TaxID=118510 RepID=A0A6L2LT82_TANCI|nr:retrovirus-related Pol polyprotein from transposon TNT 1-94 [Tanacetum cinerariifolium]
MFSAIPIVYWLMLAPRSANATYSTELATMHEIRKLPVSPNLDLSRTSHNWACQLGHQRGVLVERKECPLDVRSFGFHLLVGGLAKFLNSYRSSFLGNLLPYNLHRRYEKTFWAAQKVSSRAAETASRAAETARRAAGGYRWVARDEQAGSDGQPGGPNTYEELTEQEKLQDDCDDQVKLLKQATELSQQERECKLYNEFDRFTSVKGESLHEYYLRFAQLMNDMHTIGMTMQQVQVNTKFLNSLPHEWSKFVNDFKLAKNMHTSNYDQLYAYPSQHEAHATETDDLDAFDSDCDEAPGATTVLMANLSSYNSDVIYEIESVAVQDTTSTEQQNAVIISVFDEITNCVAKMFKLDIEPLFSKLKNHKEAHEDYLKKTKEHTNTLRRIVKQARKLNPSDPYLEYACRLNRPLVLRLRILQAYDLTSLSAHQLCRKISCEDLGKLKPKADNGIFIDYASAKKAYQIYNKQTRQIMKTFHVDFDELISMASKKSSSGPALHEMTHGTISSGIVQKPPPSTPYVPPTKND